MAPHSASDDPAPGGDRRREPRVPAAFPASLSTGRLRCGGRIVDAAEHGVLIELAEPLLWEADEVTVTLALPASEPWAVSATAVRECAGEHGRSRIALRMSEGRPGPRPRRRTPSDRPVRSLADLCTRAYELAVQDPSAPVPEVLERALMDLDARATTPADARGLLEAIARRGDAYSPDQPR